MPIFPLEGVVLMPGAVLPLHVFEERYRRMLSDVMDGTGVMGIATVLEPSESGPDPVHSIVGVGLVVARQVLPDGRSNILVQHVGTGCLVQEHTTTLPYRRVQLELVDEPSDEPVDAIAALKVMILQIGAVSEGAAEQASRLAELDGVDFLDATAARVLPGVERRLAYLEASSWRTRAAVLEESLASYMAALMPGEDA